MGKENENCVCCDRITPREELKENAKFSTSGFAEICNVCASVLESEIDAEICDRA